MKRVPVYLSVEELNIIMRAILIQPDNNTEKELNLIERLEAELDTFETPTENEE